MNIIKKLLKIRTFWFKSIYNYKRINKYNKIYYNYKKKKLKNLKLIRYNKNNLI